jgi:hypothetical protein
VPRKPSSILEVRVSSPRLVWLGLCGILARFIKLGFAAAVVAAIGWALHQGYKRVVLDNPDFQLRVIDLNDNPVIDELALVELTNLDLTSNITRINSAAMKQVLLDQPAITSAIIERHLPDTLVVRVTTREPLAWLAVREAGAIPDRAIGGLLVDADFVPYPCPELQFENALPLPIIVLKEDPDHPVKPGKPLRHDSLRQCIALLDQAATHTPDLIAAIHTLDQPSPWSVRAVTHDGTEAMFGLRDHPRQLARLGAALDHARNTGRELATINLIPRENIPITLKSNDPPPPRAIPVEEPVTLIDARRDRRNADLDSLLNRH